MSQELLDRVDQNDTVIDIIPRSQFEGNPDMIYREIAILIYDQDNRILTQQRSHLKRSYPLYWIISVAGHVPSGMEPQAAALKELQEELGFSTELSFISKLFIRQVDQSSFAYLYYGVLPTGTKVTIDPLETEQFRLINKEGLEQMMAQGEKFEPHSLQVFQNFFKGLSK